MGVRRLIAVLTAALLAAVLTTAAPAPARADDGADTVIIELRVWQGVDDAENLWVSARPRGGRWDTLGTIPLPEDGLAGGYDAITWHRFGDIAMAGVGLRVWQRVSEPGSIYVQACDSACPEWVRRLVWRPPGKIPLPLDDGHSPGGRYRYGDIDVAVPRDNPGLLADREHLLALRDVLEGDGAELDWSAGRPTKDWEGIAVAGTPLRVTGLNLANRGLTGEIWGYLGALTELTEVRLDGNALTGLIPSKLSLLTNLTHVYLAGNDFEGCVPPRLRATAHNDLGAPGLPDCPAPPAAPGSSYLDGFEEFSDSEGPYSTTTPGPHRVLFRHHRELHAFVFDVPPGSSVHVRWWEWSSTADMAGPVESIFDDPSRWGFSLHNARYTGTWLFLDQRTRHTAVEFDRSPYLGCIYDCRGAPSDAAWIEQVAASMWVNAAIGRDGEWVWP